MNNGGELILADGHGVSCSFVIWGAHATLG
jgi:hypothetical protein